MGNTIFNWGDQVPMAIGVKEDDTCRNYIIAHNNINFYTETDIMSEGAGTLVKDNLSLQEEAYVGLGRSGYPDFTRQPIERFIRGDAK